GVGHRGITVPSDSEIALTYSIGFRAPSSADLLSSALSLALATDPPNLFGDAGRHPSKDSAEISSADLAALRRFVITDIEARPDDAWATAMGEAVTSGGESSGSARASRAALTRRFSIGGTVAPAPATRMAWASLNQARAALFINGESHLLPAGQAFAAPFLCGNGSEAAARRLASNPGLISLASTLLRAGVIRWRG
ncbi:MAG: hypothetical protein ABI565_08330, partial [Vicinamibacteria bacterium]